MKNSGRYRNRSAFCIYLIGVGAVLSAGVPAAFASGGGLSVIPDSSVFIQIVNFLLLIWMLNLVLYKPIRNILAQRKEKVDGLENSVEKLNTDASEKDKAYLGGIKEARAKGFQEKQKLIDAAAEEEKEVAAEISRKAQANMAEIKEKIAKDTGAVKASLEQEVDTFAEAIGQKILGRAI